MRLGDFSDPFDEYAGGYTVLSEDPYGIGSSGQTMPTLNFEGTEPVLQTVESAPATTDLRQFFNEAGSVLTAFSNVYSKAEQQKIAADRMKAGAMPPPGSQFLPAQPKPQSFFDTPQGKAAIPIGIAALILLLA